MAGCIRTVLPTAVKVKLVGAGDMELPVRGIVEHVAFIRMRLAPGVLVRTKVSGFAKISRTRILCCVQVVDLNPESGATRRRVGGRYGCWRSMERIQ